MNAGTLFVELSLMGADKLFKGLETANKHLNQIKESGLESAKNLNNAFSRFEATAQNASTFGSIMKQFQESTGLSAITLQKFQRAFIDVGVSADETRQSIVGIQDLMNEIQRGRPIPQSMALALRKANIDPTQIKDIYGFVDKLRSVSKSMNVDIGRSIFQDLGLSGTFYQGLRRSRGDLSKVGGALSEGTITSAEAQFNKIQKFQYNMQARLTELLSRKEVSTALDAGYRIIMKFVDLFEALIKLSDRSGATDAIISTLEFITTLTTALTTWLTAKIEGKETGLGESLFKSMGGKESFRESIKDLASANKMTVSDFNKQMSSAFGSIGKSAILPNVSAPVGAGAGSFQINQVNNNYGEPKEIANSIHKKNVQMVEHYKNIKTPQGK